MSAPTFPGLLEARLRADPARPLVTFYDDASGERIELSAATYANWVAKTAWLLRDELDVERGAVVLLDLPTHWLGPVWLGAAWTVGAAVTDDVLLAERADLVVCGPDGVGRYAPRAADVPVVALSLRPLGARFAEPLPPGVTDYGAVVLGQPDVFVGDDPVTPDDVAWRTADAGLPWRALLGLATDEVPVTDGGRLLTDLGPCTRAGVGTLLAPLRTGGATVWVRHPDPERWREHRDAERATDELRAPGQPARS